MPREMSADALELVAARFRAMGEPIRLRILQTLERQEKSVFRPSPRSSAPANPMSASI